MHHLIALSVLSELVEEAIQEALDAAQEIPA
jgi:hypothetical protein